MKFVRTRWRFIAKSWRVVAPFILLFLCIGVPLFLASPRISAGEEGHAKENIDWASPDGKFAFLTSYGEDLRTIDLIDKKSGEKLQKIDESDSSQTYWNVLWAPDSKRFALMTRIGHPIQGVDVFFRRGKSFRKTELADNLPKADIPEKLKRGKNFPHVASMNWETATQWKKDGSLVVTIDTMIDGAGDTIEATRTVLLRFDRAGKMKILKSTIKYETTKD